MCLVTLRLSAVLPVSRRRIEAAGGFVAMGRVNSYLAVSRPADPAGARCRACMVANHGAW